jgi:hypothetical protein
VLRLTDELNGTETYGRTADLAEHVLDPDDGVLVRLSEFPEGPTALSEAATTAWVSAPRPARTR